MQGFEARDPLPLRFVMYFPTGGTLSDANLTNSALLEAVAEILCLHFGGVTSYPAMGRYKRATGELQSDSVQVLEAYCETRAWEHSAAFVFTLAETIAALLGQESLACSVGGWMHLMKPHPAGPPRFPAEADLAGALAAAVDERSPRPLPPSSSP